MASASSLETTTGQATTRTDPLALSSLSPLLASPLLSSKDVVALDMNHVFASSSSSSSSSPVVCDAGLCGRTGGDLEGDQKPATAAPTKSTVGDDEEQEQRETRFEQTHVHEVYNTIAQHFSQTRYKMWPKVAAFVEMATSADAVATSGPPLIADVGCGNGKNMIPGFTKGLMVGSDRCVEMIDICRGRELECMVCDNLWLPYRSNVFDSVLSIAVIHHFSTAERRLAAVQELVRITRPNGLILIYVWALEQQKAESEKRKFVAQDNLVPWQLQPKYCPASNSTTTNSQPSSSCAAPLKRCEENVEGKDCRTDSDGHPGIQKTEPGSPPPPPPPPVHFRYYHMFREGELESLVGQIEQTKIVDRYYDKENWAIVVQKTNVVGRSEPAVAVTTTTS